MKVEQKEKIILVINILQKTEKNLTAKKIVSNMREN